MTDITETQQKLEKFLSPERYRHTIGVMYTAASLSMCYGADLSKAMLSGLLHDCGKFGSIKEQILLCKKYGIVLAETELQIPALIHAKLGAYLAQHEYNVKDPDIINAITYHTTGRPGMTLLEKITYIADYIEPGRQKIPALKQVRYTAFTNLDKAVAISAGTTISYLEKTGRMIDTMTVKTYNYYHEKK